MPVVTMLRRYLRTACATIHATRLHVLVAAVDAVTRGGRLTLTGLGHTLRSRTSVKHTIKRMDRLLGNTHLQRERLLIYAAVTRHVLGAQTRPVIAVDWADLTTDRHWQLLRAALPVGGRAVTRYDEVHSLQKLGNRQVQRMFLRRLQQVLPAGVRPILVTDAGFRSPWFRTVEQLGWTFVGRVRNRDLVRVEPASPWIACKSLYARARATPKTVGACDLVRSQPFRCQLVVVKEPRKHRVHISVWGQKVRSGHSRKQAAGHREPWLLATSLALADYQATQANRRGVSRHENRTIWFWAEREPHHPTGAVDDFAAHCRTGTHGVVASRPRDDSSPTPLSVSSQYHSGPVGALGHHTGPPRDPTRTRPVARVRPVGRVASQPSHPVRPHDTMKFVGSPQG